MSEGYRRIAVFDIDGTLLELDHRENIAYAGAFEQCFGIRSIDLDWNNYLARTDLSVAREILHRHFERPSIEEELRKVLSVYVERVRNLMQEPDFVPQIVAGTQQMLHALTQDTQVGVAIASGNLKEVAELRLQRSGLWGFFECGVFAEEGEDKGQMLQELRRMSCRVWPMLDRAADYVLVGDQLSDLEAARKNKFGFIGIGHRPKRLRTLRDAGVEHVFTNFLPTDAFCGALRTV